MIFNILAICSAMIFFGFNLATTLREGALQSCYSEVYYKWPRNDNVSVFAAVTFIVALLLVPVLIEQGDGNVLQCLGFFAPVYLMCVAIWPNYRDSTKIHVLHSVSAGLCAAASFAWIVFVRSCWWVLLIAALFAAGLALISDTYKSAWMFWLEMIMFIAVYIAVLI